MFMKVYVKLYLNSSLAQSCYLSTFMVKLIHKQCKRRILHKPSLHSNSIGSLLIRTNKYLNKRISYDVIIASFIKLESFNSN